MRLASVAAGGAVGTLLRWWIDGLFPASPPAFPWATLVVNTTGAFVLGAVGAILIERVASSGQMRTFLTIGLLGSYTTFSTMALEGVLLIETHQAAMALGYWVSTLALGQMAGVYGMWLGRLPVQRKETG